MKQLILTLFALFFSTAFFTQDLIWSEDFDGTNNWGVVNEDIGFQGQIANHWWISDAEAGNAAGMCGSVGGGDNSLHVSSNPGWVGDIGAAYEIGAGVCAILPEFCPTTEKRSVSNTIVTTGYTDITINFTYIENGQGSIDNAILEYSTNNGSSWMSLADMPKTTLCPNSQGLWTTYSTSFPVMAEDISSLQIAFKWTNNDDGVGVDPSFAVDDIEIWGMPGDQPCLGDFNDDGIINTADLLSMLSEFSCTSNCTTDMNGDGVINSQDMLDLLAVFGSSCD